jgi:LPXTG-motif cell wall-anchored protein
MMQLELTTLLPLTPPLTGDSGNPVVWIAIAAVAIIGVVLVVIDKRKK